TAGGGPERRRNRGYPRLRSLAPELRGELLREPGRHHRGLQRGRARLWSLASDVRDDDRRRGAERRPTSQAGAARTVANAAARSRASEPLADHPRQPPDPERVYQVSEGEEQWQARQVM